MNIIEKVWIDFWFKLANISLKMSFVPLDLKIWYNHKGEI